MKKFLATILLFLLTINTSAATFFQASKAGKINVIEKKIEYKQEDNLSNFELSENEKIAAGIKIKLWVDEKVTQERLLNEFASCVGKNIPKSYKYINLNIRGIFKGQKIYDSLQKLVYLDLIPNKSFLINRNKALTAYQVNLLAEKVFKLKLISSSQIKSLKARKANNSDLDYIKKIITKKYNYNLKIEENNSLNNLEEINLDNSTKVLEKKEKIFKDVYKTLLEAHYDKKTLKQTDLLDGAIKGLAKGTGDKFTTYFPPVENKNFMESLDGKFEGIGSYVDMEQPGVLKIISPISGSPSEKAGIKGGDIIIEVDGKKITEKVSLKEAVSWIKGPKKTPVVLKILRDKKILEITVIRDTIVIKNVEYKKLDYKTFYIKLVSFGDNISGEFDEALVELKKNRGIKKVILDLRNNPGGYLHEVSKILSNFVPKGKETVVVKYLSGDKNYYSTGKTIVDFNKYRIIILQNSGSASASEIMIGTIKDYFPNATIIGEKSYGKGSVQTIKPYSDGSSLKYTIAKWFTGKTQTGIDHIGISPNIKLEFDFEKFKKTKIDNQLEKAKNMR